MSGKIFQELYLCCFSHILVPPWPDVQEKRIGGAGGRVPAVLILLKIYKLLHSHHCTALLMKCRNKLYAMHLALLQSSADLQKSIGWSIMLFTDMCKKYILK